MEGFFEGEAVLIPTFFQPLCGKRIVVTGHTGFKGSWLVCWLKKMGAQIMGISIGIPTIPSHFEATKAFEGITDNRIDVRNQKLLRDAICDFQPDFLFHFAAQSLVKKSYADPEETWSTNLMGTINVLESLRFLDHPCSAVLITSDKCYENVEWLWGYREIDALGGIDPYSASKGASEIAIRSYVNSFFPAETSKVRIASARAGNVIGGGDWALDRIVPDCVKSWSNNEAVEIRRPNSTRPWQHVLEPLSGYLNLAIALLSNRNLHGEAFNFGPSISESKTVKQLVQEMSRHWDKVAWNDVSSELNLAYEANLLQLNCEKAMRHLCWQSGMTFHETVQLTVQWYRKYYEGSTEMSLKTSKQIDAYVNIAREKKIKWAQ